jgi:phytoene synthase
MLILGFKQAKAITQKYAKTFYFASYFLSKDKRYAAYSIYAICRVSDEAVDNQNKSSLNKLEQIRENIEKVYSTNPLNNNLLLAFRETIRKYCLPKQYFDQLLEGMGSDIMKNRYADFPELKLYCYKVAGVVGLMMLRILGYSLEAEKYAVNLGIAMQLTNIIRDIKEDFDRNRIYLPQDELTRFGVRKNDIASGNINQEMKSLLLFQIKRARDFYAAANPGVKLIPDRRSRFVILCMKEIYAGILDAIEKNGCDVFTKRAHVTISEKINKSFKILRKGALNEN